MKKVYKYTIVFADAPTVWLPKGAVILIANEQNNSIRDDRLLYLWCIVDEAETESIERKFRIAGTGHPLGEDLNLNHISTIFTQGDILIFHIFEILP